MESKDNANNEVTNVSNQHCRKASEQDSGLTTSVCSAKIVMHRIQHRNTAAAYTGRRSIEHRRFAVGIPGPSQNAHISPFLFRLSALFLLN